MYYGKLLRPFPMSYDSLTYIQLSPIKNDCRAVCFEFYWGLVFLTSPFKQTVYLCSTRFFGDFHTVWLEDSLFQFSTNFYLGAPRVIGYFSHLLKNEIRRVFWAITSLDFYNRFVCNTWHPLFNIWCDIF